MGGPAGRIESKNAGQRWIAFEYVGGKEKAKCVIERNAFRINRSSEKILKKKRQKISTNKVRRG